MESEDSQPEVDKVLHLLTEADQWNDLEVSEKVSNALDAVISFLRSLPPAEEGVQVARVAFGSILPHLQINRNAFCLLDVAFSFLKSSYSVFLQNCEGKVAASISHINNFLQQCCVILECCELGLKFLLQAEKIAVEDLNSFPQVFLYIVTCSLTHCRQSKTIYSSQLDQVQDSLSKLFQLTVEMAMDFGNFLSKLTFDSFSDDDLEILIEVCDKLCTTAACLSELSEVRGSVTLWRCYASLIQQYHTALVTRLDLGPPVTALVKEIRDGHLTLVSLSLKNDVLVEKDMKVVQRIIKMTSFCLKVVIALCEKFQGYLGGVHSTLVLLVLLLFRFSPKNVVLSDYPDEIKKDLEHQVTIGIEPLLMHLKDDEDFIKEVEESVEEESSSVDDWGSHILLLTALLFPLRNSVTSHANTIVSKIFQTMERAHVSLSFPCMMDGIMCGGKPQTTITLYEHILTHLCAVVATFNSEQFELLEQDLVHWLLSGQTWPALLAADMWCFIARYGTSELCRLHCVFLLEVLSETHSCTTSSQHLVINALLSRLTGKLLPAHKEDIILRLKATRENARKGKEMGAGTWLSLVQDETEDKIKLAASEDFIENVMQHMSMVLSRNAADQDVINFMNDIQDAESFLSAYIRTHNAEDPVLSSFTGTIIQLWARVPLDYIQCHLVQNLVCDLLKISVVISNSLSNFHLLQMLCLVKECCQRGSVVVRVNTCDLVTALGHCTLPPSSDLTTLSLMSDVLSDLLKDENPLIHQLALDSFVAVGKHTSHEEVLPMCLGCCEEKVRQQVTLYLQQEPNPTHQPLLSLLQHQSVTACPVDVLKNETKLIASHIVIESEQHGKDETATQCQNQSNKKLKVSKRCREGDIFVSKEMCDINMLVDSLNGCINVITKIKENNVIIDGEESEMVKRKIEEMLKVWVSGTNFDASTISSVSSI